VGFDAGTAVEPLDWDFTKFDLGRGTIPEPSEREMTVFTKRFQKLMTAIINEGRKRLKEREEVKDDVPELTLMEALAALEDPDLDAETIEAVSSKMCGIVAELSKGQPSLETLEKLPSRVRGAFFGWLLKELYSPEAVAAGTRPSLSLVPGG
jgi:hypothetical protein